MRSLESFVDDLGLAIPTCESEDVFVFRPDMFPEVPAELTARELVASIGAKVYDPDFRVRMTTLFGTRRAFRSLGLLLIARVLRPSGEFVRIHLDARLNRIS